MQLEKHEQKQKVTISPDQHYFDVTSACLCIMIFKMMSIVYKSLTVGFIIFLTFISIYLSNICFQCFQKLLIFINITKILIKFIYIYIYIYISNTYNRFSGNILFFINRTSSD